MPREQNFRAYLLSKLANTKIEGYNKTVIQDTITTLTIMEDERYTLEVSLDSSWMSPILCYLQEDELPLDEGEAKKIFVASQANMNMLEFYTKILIVSQGNTNMSVLLVKKNDGSMGCMLINDS